MSLLSSLSAAWNEDYISLACSDNVMRLRSRLTEYEKNSSFVIHIFHKYVPYEPVKPRAQRLHTGNRIIKSNLWTFHAVLYTSGLILDLDYTDSPRVEGVHLYFKKMWPKIELYEDYRFQIKPANLYSRIDSNGRMDEDLYPHLTFEDLKELLSFK